MSFVDDLLQLANTRAGELATPGMDPRPRKRLAVLTCMDARIDILLLLGLQRGDAHIIRNAGGLVTDDAIRSLTLSQRLLGTDKIVVVMHEGCGLQGVSEQDLANRLASVSVIPNWQSGAFDNVDTALGRGLDLLRGNSHLRTLDIRGLVFDPETGSLREVCGTGDRNP